MPGHNSIENFNKDAANQHGGFVFDVVAIGDANPNLTHPRGYIKCAFLINTSGTDTTNKLYINTGTVSQSVWETPNDLVS
jgi:hypothetical protein